MKCSSLSASTIKTYITCPFKLYLTKHLGIDMGTNFGAEQGTLVHAVFEEFGCAKRDGVEHPDIERNWIDVVLDAYRGEEGIWKLSKNALTRSKKCAKCSYNNNGHCFIADLPVEEFEGCPANEFKDALNLVELVLNDPTPQNPLNKTVIGVENKFVLKIKHPELNEDIPVVGYIDIATENTEDTVEIWDYKTGKYVQNYAQCAKDPQLLIYHLAARSIFPKYKNVIITIYYLRKAPISLSFGLKDERGTVKALQYYWKTIRGDICPKRRADNPDGSVNFDWKCKNLCKPEICKKEYQKFLDQGGVIIDNTQTPYDDNKNQHHQNTPSE